MGASREMFQDEKIVGYIHSALPNLITVIWANHSHQMEGMFTADILEQIEYLERLLSDLKSEFNQPSSKKE